MDRIVYVYVLRDPRNNEVRYVGKSVNPKARFYAVRYDYISKRMTAWQQELKELDIWHEQEIIDECKYNESAERELQWIQHFVNNGSDLVNKHGVTAKYFDGSHIS